MFGRTRIALGAAVAALSLVVPAAPASAAPSDTLTVHLTSCSGPPGTPENIDGVKSRPHEGAALLLTSMSGNFIFMEASDAITGEVFFTTPGFQHNKLELVTCSFDSPRNPGQEIIAKGLLSPANG